MILEDLDLRRRRRRGDAPEPVAVRALLRRSRAVDGARSCLQRLHRRAVLAVLRSASRPPRPSRSPTSTTRSREIERVAAAGFRAILLPATPPMPYYSRDFDPVWARRRANGVQPFFHTQTGGVKVNDPASTTLQGRDGAGDAGQPADDREVGVEADDHAGRVQPDRAVAADLRADRRRRRRALPRRSTSR